METDLYDLFSFQSLSLDPCLPWAVFDVDVGWGDGVIVLAFPSLLSHFLPYLKVMREVTLVSVGRALD